MQIHYYSKGWMDGKIDFNLEISSPEKHFRVVKAPFNGREAFMITIMTSMCYDIICGNDLSSYSLINGPAVQDKIVRTTIINGDEYLEIGFIGDEKFTVNFNKDHSNELVCNADGIFKLDEDISMYIALMIKAKTPAIYKAIKEDLCYIEGICAMFKNGDCHIFGNREKYNEFIRYFKAVGLSYNMGNVLDKLNYNPDSKIVIICSMSDDDLKIAIDKFKKKIYATHFPEETGYITIINAPEAGYETYAMDKMIGAAKHHDPDPTVFSAFHKYCKQNKELLNAFNNPSEMIKYFIDDNLENFTEEVLKVYTDMLKNNEFPEIMLNDGKHEYTTMFELLLDPEYEEYDDDEDEDLDTNNPPEKTAFAGMKFNTKTGEFEPITEEDIKDLKDAGVLDTLRENGIDISGIVDVGKEFGELHNNNFDRFKIGEDGYPEIDPEDLDDYDYDGTNDDDE